MSLLGIDLGTTGVKAVCFGLSGKVLAEAYQEYPLLQFKGGRVELDPFFVWKAVSSVIRSVNAAAKKDPVEALSVSSMGESFVPIGKNGEFLSNIIANVDTRAGDQRDWWEKKVGLFELFRITGQPYHTIFSINKIKWLKENKPLLYKNTYKFLCMEDLVLFKLGGITVTDYSLAGRMMAFDIKRKIWSKKILDAAGIDAAKLPEPVPSGRIVGEVRTKVAALLGFKAGVKLVTGSIDQSAAALGAGIIKEGVAVDSLGTAECITPVFKGLKLERSMFESNYCCTAHSEPDLYVTFAFNFTGGAILKWYRNYFAELEKGLAKEKGKDVYDLITGGLPEEPTGLLVLPHFTVTGTPYYDNNSKGAILGLTLSTGKSELVKALMEGVTYEMMLNLNCLKKAGLKVKEVRVMGGGARSPYWLQLKADMYGIKTVALNVSEAGCLGGAIRAGTATGRYRNFEEAVAETVKVKKEYYPDKKKNNIYLEKFEVYKKVYPALKDILHKLN